MRMNAVRCFSSLFTSAYLQMNREFFENFIEDYKTVKQFCNSVSDLAGRVISPADDDSLLGS